MSEPIFRAVPDNDPEMQAAYFSASSSMSKFRALVESNSTAECLAKLRFRDPDRSEQTGKDEFFYLWLSAAVFHAEQGIFSGTLFEVPAGFEKWHAVGERLGFEQEDVFDWMVNDNGHMLGGYTVRVTRSRLPEPERAGYDSYIGVKSYGPVAHT